MHVLHTDELHAPAKTFAGLDWQHGKTRQVLPGGWRAPRKGYQIRARARQQVRT